MAVVRRASCRFQQQAGCRVRSKRTRNGFSCLWGGGAALKLARRACRVALVVVCLRPVEEHRTGERLLSLARSHGATFSAAASNAKLAAACAASTQARALAVSGEEAQYSSLMCARRAALVAVCLDPIERCCAGGRFLYIDARPWCGVSSAASNAKPAAVYHASARAQALAISGEAAQHTAFRARAAPR